MADQAGLPLADIRQACRQDCHSAAKSAPKAGVPSLRLLAFTLAPHLQPINHRECFSPIVGIWPTLARPHQGWRNVRL